MADQREDLVAQLLAPHLGELVSFRRHLHAHPEASGVEHATTEAIAERLQVAGLSPQVLAAGTGVVCDVGGDTGGGPLVVLRADIDALAMQDVKDVGYRSRVPGLAHACGHDVHTAVVLGAGLVLAELFARDDPGRPSGCVRLVFEPAEETVPGGAVDVIDEGHLHGAAAVYGLHCDPKLDVGSVGLRAGAITSAADMVEISVHGPGGHTARPELTVDLVRVAALAATELPGVVAKRAAALGDLRLTFGALLAGDAANVVPTVAHLRGSLRTPDRAAWEEAVGIVEAAVNDVLGDTGATWSIDHVRGVPPVVNDVAATALMASAARSVVGDDGVVEAVRSWGGDSFAWYLEHVPGSYARLGVHDPGSGRPRVDLHAGTFDVDERAIGIGVRILVATALRELGAAPAD